jgi:hypothetical protein
VSTVSRKDVVFTILGAFFLTNALIAEMIGGKVIAVGDPSWRIGPLGPFLMSVGVIPWPVVFVTTDLVNEYFGKRGVRRLTFLTAAMIAYAFCVLYLTMQVPAATKVTEEGITKAVGVDDAAYDRVFLQTRWIIVGSLTAFLLAQLIDVLVFHVLRRRTGKALIWLRATGSTVISQLIDSVVVLYIGLAVPLGWTLAEFASVAVTNYTVKLLVAIGATPLIYLGHWAIERYLGKSVAEAIAEKAARESEGVSSVGGAAE